jgi:preprotein translocase SecE subunit
MARRSRQPAQTGRRSVTAPLAGKPKSQSGGDPVQRKKGTFSRARGFVGEVRGELAMVDFPNRQQTWQSTSVVISACVLVGLYLYGLDQVFARLVSDLLDLQK